MKEVERIIRVDHAGELGAISIYSAQRKMACFFYKDIVDKLDEMLAHEKEHFNTFSAWLKVVSRIRGMNSTESLLTKVTALSTLDDYKHRA
ncbi:demethoxyubiquinone hydroxylase family protein [Shewanella sp. VB17]|uniref:demethoxyubiquinone hydroxylase family protein n=1 Tax=Shewanella sp. VB17 TaxID=2739432 RepID=UPI001563BC9F|nr:demethoxyubiquinone hydroxylase family protein [Shewanella sp. VB17]NRD72850.1 demethoxyubiquinone hydroxylase family protein [Shewanella sp. VB17]